MANHSRAIVLSKADRAELERLQRSPASRPDSVGGRAWCC